LPVAICTNCGQENPDGFRFCGSCGTLLGLAVPRARTERKVVSVLFCDLVGFTAAGEAVDPEDTSRMLNAYHEAVRAVVERFGGIVEKFIGDAVVAVWGAPVAHEDDAERAVRAGFAILDEVDLDVRIAVNTGEVLVSVEEGADLGASMVGDPVNTASRLQGEAPVGGILVGEGTFRATQDAVTYNELAPVVVKGKAEPVPIWQAVEVGSRVSQEKARIATPFIGRQRELRLLKDVFERVVEEATPQLVTITGEPGIGKSRLVREFDGWLEAQPRAVNRLRGRCLAYGDGVGFWALSEMVKEQLGLTETASEDDARAQLASAVEGMTDAPWLRARLAPLVGLRAEAGDREELFTAWRRFLEELAARTPLVLIAEDLHWADPSMLAFVEHLAEWASAVPMLILCTARPELLDAHRGWGGGIPNAEAISLRQMSSQETDALAAALLDTVIQVSDVRSALVERCGGNPLYAHEYARLLADRAGESSGERAIPDTVQALIAARIDTLPSARKALLHHAAVVGKVFWAGAAASIGERDVATVRLDLHELCRKELIKRTRISSVPGDEEYAFWHDLVQEVAYGQIPRFERGKLHRRAADWIEHAAADRLADRAELLAHHYRTALDLTADEDAAAREELRRVTVRFLAIAGEQSMGLDRVRAERLFEEAVQLSIPDDPDHVHLLASLAGCATLEADVDRARDLLDGARSAAEERGSDEALVEVFYGALLANLIAGDRSRAEELIEEGTRRFADSQPTKHLPWFLTWAGAGTMLRGADHEAEPIFARAMDSARRVGDDHAYAFAQHFHGLTRTQSGDRSGFDDLNAGVQQLVSLGSPYTATGWYDLADQLLLWEGPSRAEEAFQAALLHGARTGAATEEMWARAEHAWSLEDAGEWDEMLDEANIVLAWSESHNSSQHRVLVAGHTARVMALRGADPPHELLGPAVDRARTVTDLQVLAPTLAAAALVAFFEGRIDEANQLLVELGDRARYPWAPTAEVGRLWIAVGQPQRALALVDGIADGPPRLLNAVPSIRGMLAEANRETDLALDHYEAATRAWRGYGHAYELAQALAGSSRCLAACNNQSRAKVCEDEAAEIFRHLGVCRHIDLPTAARM
jgi:class 3 adenylate cyclase